jgi:hypothetical protein
MRRIDVLRMQFTIALAAILSAGADSVRAQESTQSDSLKKKHTSFVALPYAFYTPETKFAFGGGSIYSFRPVDGSPSDRPSNVRIALTYTQLNQMILALLPEIYLMSERYYFKGFCGYYLYPNKFWGIGNDTPDGAEENYEQNDFESYINVQKRIRPGLYIGLQYQYQYMSPEKLSARGVLRDGTIPGSEAGTASGLGVVINHDTRNHVYQPSTGFYNQFCAVFFGRTVGSDYTFTLLSIDLRKYFSLFGPHVLAFQTYDSFITGEPPFQMLSLLGGSYYMRGYYRGRYRDKNMITFQTEYRFPLFWRFGAVGFAGFGDVAHDIEKFRLNQFKYSLGFGFRFMFDPQEKINARLDVGFGKGENAGIYAMVLEAF